MTIKPRHLRKKTRFDWLNHFAIRSSQQARRFMSFRVTKGVASQGSKTTLNSPAESRASKTSKKQARSRQNSSDAAGSETGRIKVGIRCRPANENETKAGLTKQAWSMSRTEIEQVLDADAALLKTRKQTYDYIFDENSSTRDVYDMQCAPIVQIKGSG